MRFAVDKAGRTRVTSLEKTWMTDTNLSNSDVGQRRPFFWVPFLKCSPYFHDLTLVLTTAEHHQVGICRTARARPESPFWFSTVYPKQSDSLSGEFGPPIRPTSVRNCIKMKSIPNAGGVQLWQTGGFGINRNNLLSLQSHHNQLLSGMVFATSALSMNRGVRSTNSRPDLRHQWTWFRGSRRFRGASGWGGDHSLPVEKTELMSFQLNV